MSIYFLIEQNPFLSVMGNIFIRFFKIPKIPHLFPKFYPNCISQYNSNFLIPEKQNFCENPFSKMKIIIKKKIIFSIEIKLN